MEKLHSKSKMVLRASLIGLSAFYLNACGNVKTQTNADPAISTNPQAVIIAANFSDPKGSLNLMDLDSPFTTTLNIEETHSDAVVRISGNHVYIVNRKGADNITTLSEDNLDTLSQCSVGLSTNPQDIVEVSNTKAYVSLLEPESNTSDLTVDDILIVNPSTSSANCASGFITGSIDLTSLTDDDGERFARAAQMIQVGTKLYVLIEDLPETLVGANLPGKIGIIDLNNDQVLGRIVLQGRNPVSFAYSATTEKIYVAHADYIDLTSSFGGIEEVSVDGTTRLLIDDTVLGGTPGDIEVFGNRGFVTVGAFNFETSQYETKVVVFSLTGEPNPQTFYQSQGYIQDISISSDGNVLIGDQFSSVNGIMILNAETGSVVGGPIQIGAAPSSLDTF